MSTALTPLARPKPIPPPRPGARLHHDEKRKSYQWKTRTHKTLQTWETVGAAREWLAEGLPLRWVEIGKEPGEMTVGVRPPKCVAAARVAPAIAVDRRTLTERRLFDACVDAELRGVLADRKASAPYEISKEDALRVVEALSDWFEARR